MIVETLTFQLASGTDEAAFLAADAAAQRELMVNCAAFVRRTTARAADGGWAVVSFWTDETNAPSLDALAATPFGALIDQSTVAVRRYETLD